VESDGTRYTRRRNFKCKWIYWVASHGFRYQIGECKGRTRRRGGACRYFDCLSARFGRGGVAGIKFCIGNPTRGSGCPNNVLYLIQYCYLQDCTDCGDRRHCSTTCPNCLGPSAMIPLGDQLIAAPPPMAGMATLPPFHRRHRSSRWQTLRLLGNSFFPRHFKFLLKTGNFFCLLSPDGTRITSGSSSQRVSWYTRRTGEKTQMGYPGISTVRHWPCKSKNPVFEMASVDVETFA
jgi:hypothetical protein